MVLAIIMSYLQNKNETDLLRQRQEKINIQRRKSLKIYFIKKAFAKNLYQDP